MALVNGYASLAQFKQRFAIASTDAARDTDLELIIQAVSRAVDLACGRVFYAGTPATVRYYTAQSFKNCFTDDFSAVTALATDEDGDETYETTWAATDYRLMPFDKPADWPYMWLAVKPNGQHQFPARLPAGVKVTGTFGWAAVPDMVREACLLQTNRLWERRGSPFGVLGANEFGAPTVIVKLDPDVVQLLQPFVRIAP
jgi:hypothetical protein